MEPILPVPSLTFFVFLYSLASKLSSACRFGNSSRSWYLLVTRAPSSSRIRIDFNCGSNAFTGVHNFVTHPAYPDTGRDMGHDRGETIGNVRWLGIKWFATVEPWLLGARWRGEHVPCVPCANVRKLNYSVYFVALSYRTSETQMSTRSTEGINGSIICLHCADPPHETDAAAESRHLWRAVGRKIGIEQVTLQALKCVCTSSSRGNAVTR